MSPGEAAHAKQPLATGVSHSQCGHARAEQSSELLPDTVPIGSLAGPCLLWSRGEGGAWAFMLPLGAGGLPACWAVYSITPGNSLTSAPAALLGSGGSQDDKPLLEEIPFLVQGSGGAGHARPPCKHVRSPVHTHGRAPRPGAGSVPSGDPAWRDWSFMAKSSPGGKRCWGAEQGAPRRRVRSSRSVQPLALLCPCSRCAGSLAGCQSHACALRPQLSKHSRDAAVAGGWSSPVQGHGCLNPGWGRDFVFLVPAEFEAQTRW